MSSGPAMSTTRSRWLRWDHGRQGTGYDKCLLLEGRAPFRFDCYLLRYPVGSQIPPHRDPVTGGRHFRLNLVIKPARAGGQFLCEHPIVDWGPLKLFRSDVSTHSVTRVIGSSRYVLSIGWVAKSRG